MNPHELKQLKVRKDKLEAEFKAACVESDAAHKKVVDVSNALKDINRQIAAARQVPTISEHALLRYAERVLGLDTAALTTEILTPKIKSIIETINSGKVPLTNGVRLVVKDKIVLTVLTEGVKK